jgi:site-specific DNA-methyltransferase (adenine-specific)
MVKRSTSTSAFGVSKRESHDASGFYRRFTPPDLSSDTEVAPYRALDKLIVGDARRMDEVPDSSVALVVTSPPYFAGKEYEEALGEGGVPATYLEYLQLLREVFRECARLSADVIGILQDDLRLLLRGEIIWVKQRGSSGSCAWGSFQRPGNPVLRDLTERVIVASKGRFDRAVPAKVRSRRGLPSDSSMTRDDFMENTLDVWEVPAESATRVGHPAPFPVELPARLIELYRGDLVLDPFAGSGTTAVAAVRTGRHYAGYDLDESYIGLAETRVEQERRGLAREASDIPVQVVLPAIREPASENEDFQSLAVREGRAAKAIARSVIEAAGFRDIQKDQRQPGGVEVNFTARDIQGKLWSFDVTGSFTSHRAGLKRTDTLWKALGKAAVLQQVGNAPLVLLTTDVPARGGAGAEALRQVTGPKKPVHAVIEILKQSGLDELRAYCEGKYPSP